MICELQTWTPLTTSSSRREENSSRQTCTLHNCKSVSDKGSEGFSETQPIITRKRKANQVMEGSKKMELRMENLTKYIEDFTNYVAELGEEDFKKPATPSSVIESANKSLEEREQEVSDKLAEHEEVLRQAEQVLSMVSAQQQVVEKKEESAAFATFKQKADFKPAMLEHEASFAEA